jgi:hypothetical protein|tara:strand:+ start:1524 stop:1625 length:102 start_codon:yes stop_codon:yes gene_type:complete
MNKRYFDLPQRRDRDENNRQRGKVLRRFRHFFF